MIMKVMMVMIMDDTDKVGYRDENTYHNYGNNNDILWVLTIVLAKTIT